MGSEPTTGYARFGLWLDTTGEDLAPRPAMPGSTSVDVAIVGGGLTGVWTAYYLAKTDPSLRIAVVEREIAGFGGSGRNGGWCSAVFAADHEKIARRHGRDAAIAMQRAMFDVVDEVGRVCEAEGIDAHYAKGGTLAVATIPPHVQRIQEVVAGEHAWGFTEEDIVWLDEKEATSRVAVDGCLGASYTPHCAAVHPARLARGLARVAEGLGVRIFEQTPAVSVRDGVVSTTHGTLEAEVVVRALEGYTGTLPEHRRRLLPMQTFMIATEPLAQSFWDEVGWKKRETLADGAHLFLYIQRTADDRIALGGRSLRYNFGSGMSEDAPDANRFYADIHEALCRLFPGVREAEITHRWGGYFGAPRDWFPSVGYDRERKLAWGGGYVGDGVPGANLAGRTLADLIVGRETDRTRLPWVNHAWRKWEPEPLRWLGANFFFRTMARADRVEFRTGRASRLGNMASRVIGL